jgi:formate dehydrogenase subunit gamma
MWSGNVDVNWAKEHHSLWLQQEEAKGRVGGVPPEGRMQPAE